MGSEIASDNDKIDGDMMNWKSRQEMGWIYNGYWSDYGQESAHTNTHNEDQMTALFGPCWFM